jgi:hypothetical protein
VIAPIVVTAATAATTTTTRPRTANEPRAHCLPRRPANTPGGRARQITSIRVARLRVERPVLDLRAQLPGGLVKHRVIVARGGVCEDGCEARARHGERGEDGVVGDGSVGGRAGDVIAEEAGGVVL